MFRQHIRVMVPDFKLQELGGRAHVSQCGLRTPSPEVVNLYLIAPKNLQEEGHQANPSIEGAGCLGFRGFGGLGV